MCVDKLRSNLSSVKKHVDSFREDEYGLLGVGPRIPEHEHDGELYQTRILSNRLVSNRLLRLAISRRRFGDFSDFDMERVERLAYVTMSFQLAEYLFEEIESDLLEDITEDQLAEVPQKLFVNNNDIFKYGGNISVLDNTIEMWEFPSQEMFIPHVSGFLSYDRINSLIYLEKIGLKVMLSDGLLTDVFDKYAPDNLSKWDYKSLPLSKIASYLRESITDQSTMVHLFRLYLTCAQ